ncbi:MAG: regulatory protein RecX [Candidatus Levybacteria bacterium]|nr:regulatory protein RecX [Candidatus Levybacteria bacterium]
MADSVDQDFEKFYNKALKFLSYRPRSEKEVGDRLRIRNQESGIRNLDLLIDQVIQKLKEYNFLSDLGFAKKWIEERRRLKPRSLRLIKLELRRKGISEEIIESIIHDSRFMIQSDLEQAKILVQKRLQRLKGLPTEEIFQKLGRYLVARGFDWDTIKKAIDPVRSQSKEDLDRDKNPHEDL